jgi:hypothetical protein
MMFHNLVELTLEAFWWFTKGFDTRDLKEAKSLLKSLEA